ncbi:MAG: hypothetical protein WD988_02305 [Candidatus Curtissbacteria bacterium]
MAALFAKRLAVFISLIVLSLFVVTCVPGSVIAGSGLVSSVGGATFIQGASQFWVTSQTPAFSGVASAGANISGTVGAQGVAATADSSGNWSWVPQEVLAGDNAVSITDGTATVNFTLTIGDVPANIASASAASLPPAGYANPTLILLIGGFTLSIIGGIGFKKASS